MLLRTLWNWAPIGRGIWRFLKWNLTRHAVKTWHCRENLIPKIFFCSFLIWGLLLAVALKFGHGWNSSGKSAFRSVVKLNFILLNNFPPGILVFGGTLTQLTLQWTTPTWSLGLNLDVCSLGGQMGSKRAMWEHGSVFFHAFFEALFGLDMK